MRYSSISTNVRDDNDYLDEWVSYHLGIGFEHITIYDHKSIVPVENIWGDSVTVIRTEKEELRTPEIIHMNTLRDRPSFWLAVIDVDEFIVLLQHKNINELLVSYGEYGGVIIPWSFYGSDGHVKKPKGLVRDSYLWRTPDKDDLGKTIINTQYCKRMIDPHYIESSRPVVTEDFNAAAGSFCHSSRKLLKINHYFTRSYDEWVKKVNRGSGNPNTPPRPLSWYNDILRGCNIYDPVIAKDENLPKTTGSTLRNIFNIHPEFTTDKGGVNHTYLEIYDKLFLPFKDKEIGFLEVGYATGGSVDLFELYFYNAHITSIDIDGGNFKKHSNRVTLICDDVKNLTAESFKGRPIHIAMDDGSHILEDQIAFVKLFYPLVEEGGMLIVEDILDIQFREPIFRSLGYDFEVIDMRSWNNGQDNSIFLFRK
jgi:hypothetical protein